MTVEQIDVLIVGAGPAGMSTALHLIQAEPSWAGRIVVVEKAAHPRDKLCGGGITGRGDLVLSRLGFAHAGPQIPVRELQLRFGSRICRLHGEPLFRIVQRAEFDHWLVRCGESRGLQVRQGETVLGLVPIDDQVEVTTDRTTYRARVVVGADGSGSIVRRTIRRTEREPLARLLEVLTAEVRTPQRSEMASPFSTLAARGSGCRGTVGSSRAWWVVSPS